MSKKILLIGKTGSGKTTLCQKLHEMNIHYKKTQAVEYYDNAIDTPGEYLENRNMYHAFLVTAADADIIGLVGDPTAEMNFIPPAFSGSFAKEVIGIITKVNLADKKQIERVREQLEMAGVNKIFKIDTLKGIGIKELFRYLEEADERRTLKCGN